MSDILTARLVLRPATAGEVSAVLSGQRRADWAADFPAEGDQVIAGLLVTSRPVGYGTNGSCRAGPCGGQPWLVDAADLDGGAIGADLLATATQLVDVEAHREDGVGSSARGDLDQPVLGLRPAG